MEKGVASLVAMKTTLLLILLCEFQDVIVQQFDLTRAESVTGVLTEVLSCSQCQRRR